MDGPLLVLAGAGSGKTRVITRRVANLICRGVPAGNVLAITFTNKAAGEMRQRVAELGLSTAANRPGRPTGATICTFHSLCARLLREYAAQAGLDVNFTIYDTADQRRLIKQIFKDQGIRPGKFSPTAVHGTISNAKNDMFTPDAYASKAHSYYQTTVAQVYGEYQRRLWENRALDFDDLLVRMAYLLRDRPEVREELSQRFRYVLIDEYQDTNHAQYLIAHTIAMEHQNICATGDPDQSIYHWRGANIRNILEFEKDYPNAAVIRLEENYRSTKAILTTASSLISHNKKRKEKALWTSRSGGDDVKIVLCDDEHAEANYVVQAIRQHQAGGGGYGDVAVFYRLNSFSRVLEEAMVKEGVPYRIARGVEFYNRREVKDVLAYLKVLVNPADDVSCRRIINVPKRGIGSTSVGRLAAHAARRGISLLAAAGEPEEAGLKKAAAKRVSGFVNLMNSLAAEKDGPVSKLIEAIINRTHMEHALKDDDGDDDNQPLANLAELVSSAAEFDESAETGGGSLEDYLQQVSLVSDVDHFEGGDQAVTLMTLHAAKGLEFPVVFVVGCEDGVLPFEKENSSGSDGRFENAQQKMEEERRLLFVGMTRAQEKLTLTSARRRMIHGRTNSQAVSPFLMEIGDKHVRPEDNTTFEPARPKRRYKRSGGKKRQKPAGSGFYDDVLQREIIEAATSGGGEPMPPEYVNLKAGLWVRHPKFGTGRIVSMSQSWPNTRAVIDFKGLGRKKIVLRYADLEFPQG